MNEPRPIEQQENRLILTTADRQSATWGKVMRFFDIKLQALREKNDATLDELQTAKLRGQIELIKELRRANEADPEVETLQI